MTLEEVLRSPQFRQALFEVQTAECERLWAEMQQGEFSVVPKPCPAKGEFCKECDYLVYCTNHGNLRDE